MSQFLDALFIDFSGAPITGRVPPRVTLHGDVPPEVITEAAHAYDAFRKQRGVSIIDTHIAEDFLSGGGFMAVHSHGDIDEIEIWGEPPPAGMRLPHALVVVASWRAKPIIYKRVERPGVARKWLIDPIPVPQAVKEIRAYNAVELVASAGGFFIAPMVKNPVTLWGVDRRNAPNYASAVQDRTPVPINLRIGATSSPRRSEVHYSFDGSVYEGDTAIYTMTPPPHILLNQEDGLYYLPSDTTTAGGELALNAYRSAYVSELVSVFRVANERVKRTGDSAYIAAHQNLADIWLPPTRNDIEFTGGEFGPTSDLSSIDPQTSKVAKIELKLDAAGYFTSTEGSTISRFTRVWPTPNVNYFYDIDQFGFTSSWGVTEHLVTPYSYIVSYNAFTKGYGQKAAGDLLKYEKVIAVCGSETVEYARLLYRIAYPMNGIIRGGQTTTYTYSNWYFGDSFPPKYWMNISKSGRRDRVDLKATAEGTVQLDLGWTVIDLMELTGLSTANGSTEWEDKQGLTNIEESFITAATSSPYPGVDYVPPELTPPGEQRIAYGTETSWRSGQGAIGGLIRMRAEEHTGTRRGPRLPPGTVNRCDYSYTTHYVIDYDHRARFFAAIRVNVVCTGHHYSDNGSTPGVLLKVSDPTYSVTISFVSRWMNGTDGRVENAAVDLVKEWGVVRRGFEMYTFSYTNPFLYPSPDADEWAKMKLKFPPRVGLPLALVGQLTNLTRHQGVNPHFAGEYYQPAAAPHKSRKGIEFNTTTGNRGHPYFKYPPGMLYARTFKLSDFPDALWLLGALKIDAFENDDPNSNTWPYYYFPVIGGNLASTRHVELRDGILTNWSDDIPADEGSPPAAWNRNIKLFRV